MTTKSPVRVFLVDDSPLVRAGLTIILDADPGLEVVGEAEGIAGAADAVSRAKADVVVVDLRLGEGDGLELCRILAERQIPSQIVVLSAFLSEELVQAAFRVGARSYVVKDVEPGELVSAIHAAARGETTIDPKVMSAFGMWAIRLEPRLGVRLRASEIRILQHLCAGRSNEEIAQRTELSVHTVRSYLRDIFVRLGAKTRAEAVSIALRAGLEPAPSDAALDESPARTP